MKTTPAHFKTFCDYARIHVAAFGLTDWEISYEHAQVEGFFATASTNLAARKATITLSVDVGNDAPTDEMLDKSALHEVLHVLLAPLADLIVTDRKVTHKEAEGAEHGIVMRLLAILEGKL